MKKVYFVALALSFFLLGNGRMAQAETPVDTEVKVEASKPVEAGNKICPVSGGKINEKTKATYEYQGKIYNFCCPMCINSFKKDPQGYIKKVEEELQQRK